MKSKFCEFTTLAFVASPLISLFWVLPSQAQNCNYFLGKAVGGQNISVNLCSIERINTRSVNFTYALGNERIQSQANCAAWSWTTFPERAVNYPQSQATEDLMKVVCTAPSFNPGTSIAVVFNPPSNVRIRPNGEILCNVREFQAIQLQVEMTSEREWYPTNVCGRPGFIHKSQVRFN